MFAAMHYENSCLHLIDQRLLPSQEIWLKCTTLETVAKAIEDMVVRGAPAIGCAAAWGIALDAQRNQAKGTWAAFKSTFAAGIERMARTRPSMIR